MSYVNQSDPSGRTIAIIGAAAVNALIAATLLTGLAIDYVLPDEEPNLAGVTVKLTPPPPPVATPEPQLSQAPTSRPITAPDALLPSPSAPDITVLPANPGVPGTILVPLPGTADPAPYVPVPPPSPSPTFAAQGPAPLNRPADWISTDDYPRQALTRGWEGSLDYRLGVGSDGKVTGCTVTSSSGHRVLDEAACKFVSRRARFEAGVDSSGRLVAGSYAGSVTWRIPD